jgi:hypothetical protein
MPHCDAIARDAKFSWFRCIALIRLYFFDEGRGFAIPRWAIDTFPLPISLSIPSSTKAACD